MLVGLFDVVVDSVDEGALLNDQLVQLLVYSVQLVYRLYEVCNLLVLL